MNNKSTSLTAHRKLGLVASVLLLAPSLFAEAPDKATTAKTELAQIEARIVTREAALRATPKGEVDASVAARAQARLELRLAEQAKSRVLVERAAELDPVGTAELQALQTALAQAATHEERVRILETYAAVETEVAIAERKAGQKSKVVEPKK